MTTATTSARTFHPPLYKNAAEWLHDLGDIPLDRIIFDPWPGSATEADLLRKCEVEKQLCELVDGTLVEKPMGFVESLIASAAIQYLRAYVSKHNMGIVAGEAGMLRLTRGLVRIPDVSFVAREQLSGGVAPSAPIPSLHPDLAIEVLSKGNRPNEMKRKVKEYFASGTRLVWLIEPSSRSALVYMSPESSFKVERGGTLDGGDILPGFKLPLKKIFADVDRKKR